MAESDGGILWRTLSREEDLLESVLLQLDPASLVSIELVCRNFRHFMQRKHIWKKRFDLVGQNLENPLTDKSESIHIQHKRMFLKLANLDLNLSLGNCQKTKTELPSVFGNYNSGLFNYSLKAMHPSLVFVEGILRDLENSLVWDVSTGRRKALTPPPFPALDCRVRSVDISSDQVCLLRTPSPEHPEETFCILETYTVNAFNDGEFSLSSQSDPQERDVFGIGIKVRLSGEEKILVLSYYYPMFGVDHELTHARVNIFEIDANHPSSPHPQKLVVTRRVKCFSDDVFSKLSVFNEDYLVGLAAAEDQVEVWDLRTVEEGAAAKVWARRIVTVEGGVHNVRISALEWRAPFLLVGKTNGLLEVWDTGRDLLLRSLEHGFDSGLKMGVDRIAVQDTTLLSLTTAGWLFAWDWTHCLAARGQAGPPTSRYMPSQAKRDTCVPSWIKKPRVGMPIMTFISNSTEIHSLEGGAGRQYMHLVKRDFLNHVENSESAKKKKRSSSESDDFNDSKMHKAALPRDHLILDKTVTVELVSDEEDIVLLDEENVDSEDVIFLGDGNVIALN